jgi:hypothetical protein
VVIVGGGGSGGGGGWKKAKRNPGNGGMSKVGSIEAPSKPTDLSFSVFPGKN